MGFSASQAQWLVQFMRNLPGGAPPEPSNDEYEQAMAAQAQQAMMGPPDHFEHQQPGYEAPPFGYWHENDSDPPQW